MFSSQYFSFPLSVQFHHCSIHIHSPTTHNTYVSLPGLQIPPVSNIRPLLHTHSFTYHLHCIMFYSQYFRFPLSVLFNHCSTQIHSPTTHTIKCFFPSTSVSICQYHSTIAAYTFIHLPPILYNDSLPTLLFPCQEHSTTAPSPFIHLPHTLYKVSLPVLQFPPVSTIPPLLHTNSLNYHPHNIKILSKYFIFPCQYHSSIAPYTFNHLQHTLYNFSLPVFPFPPVSTIPSLLHTHSFN